jgi:tubulin-specific chaperone A
MAATIKVPTIFTAEDKFSRIVEQMSRKTSSFQKKLAGMERANNRLDQFKYHALAGTVALGSTVKVATEFEDKMADISKTTGIKDIGLKNLGDDILKLGQNTRTSIPDIQEISRIGGQLGIAEKGILSFTKSANQFNVALGEDYAGGVEEAVLSVGKINSLFKDTRKLSIDDHITRIGSSFNALSSSGKASTSNINDFVLRVGTLPDVLKNSATATAGLGAFLEEVGINSERGSSGFSTLLLRAGTALPKFAAQMNITTESARELLAQDPIKFAQKFSRSLNKLSPDKLALKLKDLGIGGQESIKVVGALGNETDRLAVLMKLSTNEFKKGTSILDEYNVKNETTAANLAKSKNNFQALGITIGTKLAPVINKLISYFIPLVQGM